MIDMTAFLEPDIGSVVEQRRSIARDNKTMES